MVMVIIMRMVLVMVIKMVLVMVVVVIIMAGLKKLKIFRIRQLSRNTAAYFFVRIFGEEIHLKNETVDYA